MVDITKCKAKNCEQKDQCLRYTAPDNEFRQSYSDFSDVMYRDEGTETCPFFFPNYNA